MDMTYLNGKEILPQELLQQVQDYCAGGLVYIPQREGTRQVWGDGTGIRKELDRRNQVIREKKKNGKTLHELEEEYHLSVNSLRKILYGGKG